MALNCSIVIPNFNGEALLQSNLPSVIAGSREYVGNCEVIVVDDASTDGSVQVLQDIFPMVTVVKHAINQGFAEGIASGVAAAQYELVFLLNSDVQLKPACLNKLQAHFEDPDTFAVNPLILNQDAKVSQSSWTRSRFVHGHLTLIPWNISELPEMKASNKSFLTLYCSGGSVMMRKSMFLQLGGFSDLYKPFYYEDFDLGLRAWYQGWSSCFVPDAEVIHADKGTIENHFKSDLIKSTQRRNRYFLEWSHFSIPRILLSTFPITLLQLLGEIILFDKKNVKAFFSALKNFNRIRLHRKSMRIKKVKLPEIVAVTTSKASIKKPR